MFIATEFIDGSPLGSVTEKVATTARQALSAVHACKLLHGDVKARDIMVVQGTQPSVHLSDFGFVQGSSNWKSQSSRSWTPSRKTRWEFGWGKSLVYDSLVSNFV